MIAAIAHAQLAEQLLAGGDQRGAAAAYDRAFGLAPHDKRIARARRKLLDKLAVTEHGLRFRYVPAGERLIGSDAGDPDEQPVHSVTLGGFWLTDTPLSWAGYCRILGWPAPPHGIPDNLAKTGKSSVGPAFFIHQSNKIRLQYCEDETTQARDWHAHAGMDDFFGPVTRLREDRPRAYEAKPVVSVGWQEAEEVAAALATPGVVYGLPTEAQWEAAARGGLVGARYAWGDEPPRAHTCDFDRFDYFSIIPPRLLPPNGYGLHGMCGGVWEWTADWYDAGYYAHSATENPAGPAEGKQRVIRGGSWTDCADVVTVSFRASRESGYWRDEKFGRHLTANIGFRLCRMET